MNRLGVLLALALFGTSLPAQGEPNSPTPGDAELAAFADTFFPRALAEQSVPGAAFVVVRSQRVVLARGYGLADLEAGTPVDPERTRFPMASVSKLVTATAALQLVEQGALSLDGDVNLYLDRDQLQIAPTFPEPVTLRRLLTHTAGFDELSIGMLVPPGGEVEPLEEHLARRMPPRVLPPGKIYSYSNYGFALVGLLVQRASGMEFSRSVEQQILVPLDMSRSSFDPARDLDQNRARGYLKHEQGHDRVYSGPQQTGPAGGLIATVSDMGRFMRALLSGGTLDDARILQEATLREMQRSQFTHDPRLAGMALAFDERLENGERLLEHGGDLPGFATLLALLPARDLGFLVAYNTPDPMLREELVRAFLERFFPRGPVPPLVPDPTFASERAPAIAGSYRVQRHSRRTLEKLLGVQLRLALEPDGSLMLRAPLDLVPPVRYRELEPWLFMRVDRDERLLLRPDERGRGSELFVSTFGIPFAFERVAPWETYAAQLTLLAGCVLALLSAPFLLRTSSDPTTQRVQRLAMLIAGIDVCFVAGLVAVLASYDLRYGAPLALYAVLSLGLASGLGALVLPALAAFAWKRGLGSISGRLHLTSLALAAALFAAELQYWNLLGFHL